MKYGFRLLFPLLITPLMGCSLPPVTLTTPKPVEVDIKMRVDVYQYAESNTSKREKPTKKGTLSPDAEHLRNNRRADLQSFKNAQYIGEGHAGLLIILNEPSSDLGNQVRKIVEAENADRSVEMLTIARKEKIPLSEVQNRQGEANRIRAFKGEWIEKANLNGTFQWVQKGAQIK